MSGVSHDYKEIANQTKLNMHNVRNSLRFETPYHHGHHDDSESTLFNK